MLRANKIELDVQAERELGILSKRRRVPARLQQRASVILLAAKGWQNKDIAAEVKLDRRQVALWRRRFLDGGSKALLQPHPTGLSMKPGRNGTMTHDYKSPGNRCSLDGPGLKLFATYLIADFSHRIWATGTFHH